MKKYLAFIFASMIITGCTKKEEPATEVNFKISVSGFDISQQMTSGPLNLPRLFLMAFLTNT